MSKNKPKPNRTITPVDNEEAGQSSLDIRRLTKSVNELIDRVDNRQEKEDTKATKDKLKKNVITPLQWFAFILQGFGTVLLLYAWIMQNEVVNANTSEVQRRDNVKQRVSDILIANNLTQSRVDFNGYLNYINKGKLESQQMVVTQLCADVDFGYINLLKTSMENIPLGDSIFGSKYDPALRDAYYKEFTDDSLKVDFFQTAGLLDSLVEWGRGPTGMSYELLYMQTLAASNKYDNKILARKDKDSKNYIQLYIIGSSLLLIALLLKGVLDIVK